MAGQADTPMQPGQPPGPTQTALPVPPERPATRQAPLMASALRAQRGLPPGVPNDDDGPPEQPPRAPPAPPGQRPAPHQYQYGAVDPGRPQDPLSVPFPLPSGGIYYPEFNHQDTIYISPTTATIRTPATSVST